MKKLLSIALALTMALSMAACGNTSTSSSEASSEASSQASSTVSSETSSQASSEAPSQASEEAPTPLTGTAASIAALKGPTAMGLVKLMDEQAGNEDLSFTIAAAADELTPKLVQGELDIAAVPANLASVLYNQTKGAIQVLAVNTLGVLYIVENGDTIQSVEDLRGKTIYSSGKGSTPEYALNYMLSQNGIDPATDVTIEWKSEHSECVAALAAEGTAIAMLPQPFVTTAQAKNDKIRVALDLNAQWEALSGTSETPATLITGVMVARKEFVEANPDFVNAFLAEYKASADFVNDNTEEAAALVGSFDIVPEAVAKIALPQCNITFIGGTEMQEKLSGYLQTLFDQNPKAVGGALPADDFYYIG